MKLYVKILFIILISFYSVCFTSCYSHRIATNAQEGTEVTRVVVNSYFWGLVADPPKITTPICDSLGSLGLSEVTIKRNFGNCLVSILTIGIYNRSTIEYKCSKPCPKTIQTL